MVVELGRVCRTAEVARPPRLARLGQRARPGPSSRAACGRASRPRILGHARGHIDQRHDDRLVLASGFIDERKL